MVAFDVTEDSFNKHNLSYKLSMLLSMDSLSYMLTNEKEQVISLRRHDFSTASDSLPLLTQLNETVSKDPLLNNTYARTTLALFNQSATLVPARLYQSTEKAVYLDKLTDTTSEELYFAADVLYKNTIYNVYAVPNALMEGVKKRFPSASICHLTTCMHETIAKLDSAATPHRVYLNIRHQLLQLFYYRGQELIFYNTFAYASAKDLIYYVMLAYDQFSLDPDKCPLYLSGYVLEDSEIYHLLYRYIRFINWASIPAPYRLSSQWSNHHPHYFFDLFCI